MIKYLVLCSLLVVCKVSAQNCEAKEPTYTFIGYSIDTDCEKIVTVKTNEISGFRNKIERTDTSVIYTSMYVANKASSCVRAICKNGSVTITTVSNGKITRCSYIGGLFYSAAINL